MKKLYLIQDSDRPCYVIAHDWQDALGKWKIQIAKENDCPPHEVEDPKGISFIAEGNELLA
jgi:hypothetical protein